MSWTDVNIAIVNYSELLPSYVVMSEVTLWGGLFSLDGMWTIDDGLFDVVPGSNPQWVEVVIT